MNSFKEWIYLLERPLKFFIPLFYAMGVAGFLIPSSSDFFREITPLSLFFSYIILGLYHEGSNDKKFLFAALLIYAISTFIEIYGVRTGLIFGSYRYGDTLGIKFLDTPLLIGLNWLSLTYTTASVVQNLPLKKFAKIFIAASLMLLYDLVLEQVAPVLDFWYWEGNLAPLQNYAAWFSLAFLFHAGLQFTEIKFKNPFSAIMLGSQFTFFLFIFLYYRYL